MQIKIEIPESVRGQLSEITLNFGYQNNHIKKNDHEAERRSSEINPSVGIVPIDVKKLKKT